MLHGKIKGQKGQARKRMQMIDDFGKKRIYSNLKSDDHDHRLEQNHIV